MTEELTRAMDPSAEEKKPACGMTPAEYRSIFWRSFTIQGSWSFDKMMAYGFAYALEKPLRRIYPNDDDFYAPSSGIPRRSTSPRTSLRL